MNCLISESSNEKIIKGNLCKLNYNITKQKFTEGCVTHVLFNAPNLMMQSYQEEEFLIKELTKTLKLFLGSAKNVLVVGLGNRNICADSFGTKCASQIIATRGLIKSEKQVSVITTNVFGETGIESADLIKSAVLVVNPDVVLVLDTLCAVSYENLVTHFQFSNGGFSPGSGVGNRRKSVNKKTLNTSVVTVGVPMVVKAQSFVESAINSVNLTAMQTNKKEEYIAIFNEMIKLKFNNLVLTVKDVEMCVNKTSFVVAQAINRALNGFTRLEQNLILGK